LWSYPDSTDDCAYKEARINLQGVLEESNDLFSKGCTAGQDSQEETEEIGALLLLLEAFIIIVRLVVDVGLRWSFHRHRNACHFVSQTHKGKLRKALL